MSLQFVLGNSGSGKTVYMYEQLVKEAAANPTKDYLVVVPEQFTMQTQRELVDLSRGKAIMNIDILSFQRLAYRIFDELGKTNFVVLEETGKNLVLRKVAQEREEQLSVLRPNLNRMGYIGEVKSLISELKQYHVTPDTLREFVEKDIASPVLTAKLKDIITVYEGFQQYMEGNYITSEEILTVLCEVVEESRILRDSVVVLDGFTGFTPIQNMLIRKLLPVVDRMQVSLTIDAKEDFYHSKGVQELFDMSKQTIATLTKICDELRLEVLPPVVLDGGDRKRFKEAPSIFFMEQNLFRNSYMRYREVPGEVTITRVKNPKEELEYTVRQINALVREKGYRYKDIAVVTGAVETYANYAQDIFGKYDIPYFLDKTKEIVFHPMIEMLRAVLEVVHTNFSYESVFRFLRAGFGPLSTDEIDHLENFILAFGINNERGWSKSFQGLRKRGLSFDALQMEELREKVYDTLHPLYEVFRHKNTVETQIMSLYELLVKLEVERTLFEKEKACLQDGMQAKAKEYEQIYGIVMDVFDKMVTLIGEDTLTIEEFIEVLDAGLSAAKVASIPPGYDNVILGDIERTRLNHVKVLFFIGVNDGIIPKAGREGGIISQYERELLAKGEVELSPGTREQVFIQKFYLYLNMTKPSHALNISYSTLDADGKTLRPSYLVGNIKKIFPQIQVEEIEDITCMPDFSTMYSAKDYLIHGEKDATWYALAKCFLTSENETHVEEIEKILEASYLQYKEEPISSAVAQAVYGKELRGSVTRLERFATCAYWHFLQYGLQLKEREEGGFTGMDMGNIYHQALELYGRKLAQTEYDWHHVPDEVRTSLVHTAMRETVEEYPAIVLYGTEETKHQVKRMEQVLDQTVWVLTEQIRKGDFEPKEFEIQFSHKEGLEAMNYQLGDGISMRLDGKIDRLDTYEEPGKVCIKIVDYKSGNKKFDVVSVYHGLELQLVAYLGAAEELTKAKHPTAEILPGGIFYYHIDEPVLDTLEEMSEETYREQIMKPLRPDGLVNDWYEIYGHMDHSLVEEEGAKSQVIPVEVKKDGELAKTAKVASTEEFVILKNYVDAKIESFGKEIMEGKVAVNPCLTKQKDGCEYCPYGAICGFENRIEGYEKRKLASIAKEEIYERMQEELRVLEYRNKGE